MEEKSSKGAMSSNQHVRRLLSYQKAVRPDEVASHYGKRGVELNLRVLTPDQADSSPLVLIEGNRRSLLFLADLLLAQLGDPLDCGFQITLPSRKLLGGHSECGLYIHALPCPHPEDKRFTPCDDDLSR